MADQFASFAERGSIGVEIAGNKLELIESGEARLRLLLDLIEHAEQSIKMLMYMFNPDPVGDQVRDALASAAKRGVDVRLLIDGFGSGVPTGYFAELDQAGGEQCVFNPSYGRRYLLRNHQKLVVVDDKVAIIGGANIDDTYMSDHGAKRWRDLWLKVEGPEVRMPSAYFDTLFRWSKGAHHGFQN